MDQSLAVTTTGEIMQPIRLHYDVLDGESPTGDAYMIFETKPSVDVPLTIQLCSLMHSESYEDLLQAWELIRDNTLENVTSFADIDDMFDLVAHGFFVNNLLYDLDIALQNGGLDDVSLLAKRAEVARWVYTHFPEESALNLGNFRGYEAESLWDMGQREQAEALFQELTETFPNFAWGYIWWGDQYWMSDWSYEYAPDYDRAESLYRQALAPPDLEDRGDVQDRLEALYAEKQHPEKREEIKQIRLQHIQRRTS